MTRCLRFLSSRAALWASVAFVALGLVVLGAAPASTADANTGQALYKKRCAVCHGQGGAGDGPMGKFLKPPPPSFADASRMGGVSDEQLTKVISEGKGRMPSYSGQLSPDDVQNVLAYIRSLAGK